MNDAELKSIGEALLKQMLPTIEAAAKSAVAAASPLAAIIADPVIDEIDAYVISLLNGGVAPTVTAPTDPASQIAQLQQHVAALTVATGHGTSANMVTAKTAAGAVDAPTTAAAAA